MQRLSPNPSDASIGMQLAQQRRFADALPYLERAHRNAPANLPLLRAFANLLQWAGRFGEAAERYRIVAALLPDDTEVLPGWAHALLLAGKPDDALPVLERILATHPDAATPDGLLDRLLRETTDVDTACGLLKVMLDRQPPHDRLLALYAKDLLVAERLPDARAAYERLRALRPDDPLPHVELGQIAVSCGDEDMALAHFRSALDVAPDYAAALWDFAQIRGWRLEPAMLAHIEALLRTEHDPRALAGLHDILARHHDRAHDFAAAALHAEQTNRLLTRIVPPHARYDTRQHEAEVESILHHHSPQLLHRLRDAGRPERRPVFVIGLPRSGTTLLEQMLASHPAIIGVGEQAFAAASLQRALTASGGSFVSLDSAAIAAAAAWHLQALDERVARLRMDPDAQRVVDKQPDNYLRAGWLRIAFPNAAIIHCLRDPRDVALSCWLTQFADQKWSHDLTHIAHRIEQHRKLMRHWRASLGENLIEIRYERLVAEPETELRRALTAIHLDWHPDMLAFSERKGFVGSASRAQVRESLHARSVGRWRNYEQALQSILPRLHAIAAQDADIAPVVWAETRD